MRTHTLLGRTMFSFKVITENKVDQQPIIFVCVHMNSWVLSQFKSVHRWQFAEYAFLIPYRALVISVRLLLINIYYKN